jgi:hypothetical protein
MLNFKGNETPETVHTKFPTTLHDMFLMHVSTQTNLIMYSTRINKTNLRYTVLHTPVVQQTKLDSVINP